MFYLPRGASNTRGGDLTQNPVPIRPLLPDDADLPAAARHVDPTVRRVIEQIVRIRNDVNRGHDLPRVHVVHEQLRRLAATDKQAAVALVQRHRKIPLRARHRPLRDDRLLFAVDHGDVPGIGNVHEDPFAVLLQLERLRVGIELDAPDLPAVLGVEDRQTPVAVSHPEDLLRGVVPHIVGVIFQINTRELLERRGVVDPARAVLVVGNRNPIRLGREADALRRLQVLDPIARLPSREVDHLHRVVPQCRHEQPVPLRVQREVVDPPLNPRQRDHLHALEPLVAASPVALCGGVLSARIAPRDKARNECE
jgi:hypothetical protein